jgi:hypothetical protein
VFGCAATIHRLRGGNPDQIKTFIASLADSLFEPNTPIRIELIPEDTAASSYVAGTVLALFASCKGDGDTGERGRRALREALRWWSEHPEQLGALLLDQRPS